MRDRILYSVGISLYEMVTGQRPFESSSDFAVMFAHLKEQPKPPIELQPGLAPGLNDIILRSIAKNPAERFQTADEFRQALMKLPSATRTRTASRSATVLVSTGMPAVIGATAASQPSGPSASRVGSDHARTVLDTRTPVAGLRCTTDGRTLSREPFRPRRRNASILACTWPSVDSSWSWQPPVPGSTFARRRRDQTRPVERAAPPSRSLCARPRNVRAEAGRRLGEHAGNGLGLCPAIAPGCQHVVSCAGATACPSRCGRIGCRTGRDTADQTTGSDRGTSRWIGRRKGRKRGIAAAPAARVPPAGNAARVPPGRNQAAPRGQRRRPPWQQPGRAARPGQRPRRKSAPWRQEAAPRGQDDALDKLEHESTSWRLAPRRSTTAWIASSRSRRDRGSACEGTWPRGSRA